MVEKPAVFISDEQIAQLAKNSLCKISFQELTGKQYPWEVNFNTFQDLKAKLDHIENALRSANPVLDITCVLSGQGAFWQPREGFEGFMKSEKERKKKLQAEGPYPVWKLTSSEIFVSHLNNMRQLIMASAHDLVLLDHFKEPLGNNHLLLHREFEQCERRVRILLDEIGEQGTNLEFATSKDIILLERVRVTQEMLSRDVISKEELGYSPEELERVQSVLEKRCNKDFPKFRQRLLGTYNQAKESLRDGECTQLRRSSHWDMAFALIGVSPIGYQGQTQLARTERESMTSIVASREEEIGKSDEGQSVLSVAEDVRMKVDPHSESIAPPPSLDEEPVEKMPDNEDQNKKKRVRMAIMDRLKR